MNPKTLIAADPGRKRMYVDMDNGFLEISEFFCDTIQGEGVNMGCPAAFLRFQGCVLDCGFCDTQEVWRFGNPYSFMELYEMMEHPEFDLIRKLRVGQHLVITGGSPLKQQFQLLSFIQGFVERYGFVPYIEIENECTIMPSTLLTKYISCWNNSPKLINSGNSNAARFKFHVLQKLAALSNSWFKFVVSKQEDWDEIEVDFIKILLIKKSQIILMPQGATREELERNRETVLNIAIEQGVRYSTREHVVIWDKKTGV